MYSGISFANVAFRPSLGRAGKRNERTPCSIYLFSSPTKYGIQPSQVAQAFHKSADEVLKGMSKKMERISSITAYIKPVMDYGLAASEVGIGFPCFSQH